MKIVQIGCGAVGLVTARHLIESNKTDEIVLADIFTEKAAALVERMNADKAEVQKVDASDSANLKRLFKGCDLVVNAAIPRFNENIMLAACDNGANYLDFAMGDEFDQFSIDDKFRDAGVGALISMGEDPGMTDAFAVNAAKQLDTVESIRVRDGDNASVPGYDFVALFSPDTLIDEVLCKPVIYRNGTWEREAPFAGAEEYEFPDPVGKLTVYLCDHEEPLLIPRHVKTDYCDFKIALDPEFVRVVKVLDKVGLASSKPIAVNGQMVRPRDIVTELMPKPADLAGKVKGYGCVLVEAIGMKNGSRKKVKIWTTMSHEEAYNLSGMHATGYLVGTPGAVAAIMWAEDKIRETGVFPPERLDTDEFIARLPDFHINVGRSEEELKS